MALSGSFNTSSYNQMYIEFSWTGSQSVSGNYTDVAWKATCRRSGGSGGYYAHWSIVVAGETVNSRSQDNRILITAGTVIAQGTKRVYHNTDGTKSFSASVSASIYTYATNCTGSGSWTLNTIPRYANAVPTLTARTETTLSISWTADGIVDQFQYSIDNGGTWSTATDPNASTGSFSVSGLTANTAYNVKLKARRKDSQLTNESSAVSMSTYAYPYANSMPDFTIGNAVTLGLFNPLAHTVTVTLKASGGTTVATGTASGTTITLTGTASSLYASIPNALSANYSVSVTYDGNTSTNTGGLYIVDQNANKPTIGAFSYADSNGTATAITLDSSKIVQNISTPLFTGASLAAQNSATLASASVTVNGSTYTNNSPSATTTIQGGVINSTSNVTATLTLTDSRGISNTKTVEVEMIAWSAPTGIIEVARQSNFYTETDMKVDADYTQIGNSTVTISVLGQAVPITGQTTPADVTATLTDNVQSTINFDNNFAWNIAITLTDSFGGSTTYNTYISRGIPFVYFDRFNDSVSLNQFPTHQNSLEVNGDIYADNLDLTGDASIGGDTTITGDIYNHGVNGSDVFLETKNKIWLWRTLENETYNNLTKTLDFATDTMTINGTASATTWFAYACDFNTGLGVNCVEMQGKEYTLSIIPSGQGVEAFLAIYTDYSGNSTDIELAIQDSYTFTVPNNAVMFRIGMQIENGTFVNNVSCKLLLQETSVTDTSFKQHAFTNLELSKSLYPAEYTSSTYTSSNNSIDKTYTVHGNGFVFISGSIQTDNTSDTGTQWCYIFKNGNQIAYSSDRVGVAFAGNLGTNACAVTMANSGDSIVVRLQSTKNGSKLLMYNLVAFGCTLTT